MSYGMNTSAAPMKEKIPSGYKKGTLNNFTPEMMELFQSLMPHLKPGSYQSRLASGDESLMNEMESGDMRKFQELQGEMGSRFSGMGMGARKGSGFQNAATQASSDFAQTMRANRQQLMQNAIKDLMGMSGNLLQQRPQENYLIKKQEKKPWWKSALGAVSPIGGDIAEGGTENTQNFFRALAGMQ